MIGLRPVLAKSWFALLRRDGWAGRASVRSRAARWNAQRADLGRKSRAPTRYAYRIYPSIGEVDPRCWVFSSTGRPNLFMDPRFIATAQRSLRAARFWHVVFSTEAGVSVASASLCLYRVDLALLAGKAMHKFLASLRRIYPKFLYVDVMFCGLPISVGGNSLSFAAGCDQECVLDLLETIMGDLARQHRAHVRVFKEFTSDECESMDGLLARGYQRASTPSMNLLEGRFADFDDYCASLRSHYRNDIRRSVRKFARSDYVVCRLRNAHDVVEAYSDDVHLLYESVLQRATHKLEHLPAEFFRELARSFPDMVSLTLVKHGDRVVAFNYALSHADCYYFLFCGMDYRIHRETGLYFNLMYRDLDHAFRDGLKLVQLGQASDRFKARIGCATIPLFFYIKAEGLLGRLITLARPLLFPLHRPPRRMSVFRDAGSEDRA